MPAEREVAGLVCGQVLDLLPEFIEGSLAPETRAQVEKHLAGCNWCAEFGDKYAGLVGELQTALREPEPLGAELAARLKTRLEDEAG